MAITLGTPTNSGNLTNSTGTTLSHATAANTKTLAVIITGADSSETDSVVSGITFNSVALTQARRYRASTYFIEIWYLQSPYIGTANVVVTMGGTNTDLQVTAIGLISTADFILPDNFAESTTGSTTTHNLLIDPAKTGAIAIGGIVDIQSAVTALNVTGMYGTEITGSEADMGSQVVGCAYKAESGGTIDLRWTKSANAISYALAYSFYEQNTPTVALNTPNDTATGVSLTPALLFTGTDTEANTLEYEVQVDTTTSFNNGSQLLLDHTAGTSGGVAIGAGITYNKISQTFIGTGDKITKCSLKLSKQGTHTNNVSVEIYAISGTAGTNALPTGTALATSDSIAANTIPTIYGYVDFTFPTSSQLTTVLNTHYALVISYPYGTASIYIAVQFSDSNLTTANSAFYSNSWTTDVSDVQHKLYKPGGLITKLSSVPDAGFTAGHPFASGSQVTYTVQAGDTLTAETLYYWKVRAIDPTGSNTWGAWATTRSFTTLSNGPKVVINTSTSTLGILKGKGKLYGTTTPSSDTVGVISQAAVISYISGTINTSSTVTGDIKAIARRIGNADGVTSTVGVLRAKGKLSVIATPTITTTGVLKAKGRIASNNNLSSTTTVVLKGKGRVSSAVNNSSDVSAFLIGKNRITVTVANSSTTTGAIRAKGRLSVIATPSITATGIIKAKGRLAVNVTSSATTLVFGHLHRYALASVLTSSNVTGVIKAKGKLSSIVNNLTTTVGLIRGRKKILSTVDTITTTVGVIKAKGRILGVATPAITTSGVIKAKGRLVGNITALSDTSVIGHLHKYGVVTINTNTDTAGLIKAKGRLAVTVNAASTITGTVVNGITIQPIAGVINCSTTTLGAVKGKGRLISTVNNVSTTTGLIKAKGRATIAINTSSNTLGVIRAKGRASITINNVTSTVGVIKGKGRILSTATPVVSVTGNMRAKGKPVVVVNNVTSTVGVLRAKGRFAVTVNNNSSVVGVLKANGKLTVVVNTASTVTGNAETVNSVSCDSFGVSNVTGTVKAKGRLVGTVDNSSTTLVFGHLHRYAIASIVTNTSTTGVLKAKARLIANVNTSSNTIAVIKGKGKLIVIVPTVSTVTAQLRSKGVSQIVINSNTNTSATLKGKVYISTSTDGVSEVYGNMFVGESTEYITTSCYGQSSSLATLIGRGYLDLQLNGGSQTTSTVKGKARLRGVANNETTVISSITKRVALQGIANCYSDSTALLRTVHLTNILYFDTLSQTWIRKPIKHHNGSDWITKPIKRYTLNGWET